MANDYCQQHGGSSVCLLPQCYRRAVRGGMCSEHKAEASLQAVSARGLSTPTQSSDSERDRRAPKDNSATLHSTQAKRQLSYTTFDSSMPGWQSRMVSRQGSSELRSEFRTPTPHSTQRFQIGESSTRSPSPVRKTTLDSNELRRVDAPVAPGFSALLNANDQFPSFSTFTNKVDFTERYTRHEQQQPRFDHHEQKVYPVLPGIQALQNRSKTPCRDKLSSMIWSDVSVTTSKSSSAELRIVITGDTDKLKRISQGDNGHDNFDSDADYSAESPTGKFYVQSCYYRKNDGLLPCSTTPSRHGWGRHHS
ncbi:unnamed protein product [Phytophthora lilii]|uniref:Unnamed protein product n=1 Tax=Phytophthora lilii TaxID=2077276 RepID=A0A9W6XA00_9STRA|nr:unnamed protein product [Phytophthora lilii]